MSRANRSVAGSFKLLHPRLQAVIVKFGYSNPTEVQEKAIPLILRGCNVLIVAPTGSGKTEAALFPIFSRLIEDKVSKGYIYALYITPLKSLNRDIFVRMVNIASSAGLRLEVRHGDTSYSLKKKFLQNPPHIVVMTPETFYFLLSIERFRNAIRYLKFIVIDEVHELVADKRGVELSLALERALKWYVDTKPIMIALSATVSKPEAIIEKLFGGRIVCPVVVRGGRSYRVIVTSPAASQEESEDDFSSRAKMIAEIVKKFRAALVFTNTRDTAEILGALLKRVGKNLSVEVHHGSLSKDHRVNVESMFKSGKIKVVVSTSSLEMGIDIGHVDVVVQFSSPRQVVKLVQRVGRASHRIGGTALGYIVSSRNIFDILESAVIAARSMRGDLEDLVVPDKPYDALIHQLVGISIEKPGADLREVFDIITRSGYYRSMPFDEFMSIAGFAEQIGLIRIKENRLYPGYRAKSYYYNVTMIPDTRQYEVIDIVSGKRIGVLDEEFVATLEKGDIFVLAGRVWEVVGFGEKAIHVKPSEARELIPPAWEGELIPVEFKVAREVGSILRRFEFQGERMLSSYPLSGESLRYVSEKLSEMVKRVGVLPSDKCVLIEHYGDTFVIYNFLGSRGSKALEYLIIGFIIQSYGLNVLASSTPYAIVIKFPYHQPPKLIEDVLRKLSELSDKELENIYVSAVKGSKLYRWMLYRIAISAGVIDVKSASMDISRIKSIVSRLSDSLLGIEALKEFNRRKADFKVALDFLKSIAQGKKCVKTISLKNPSPLTVDVVSEARFTDKLMKVKLTASVLAEIVKRKLSQYNVCFTCLTCGYRWERKIGELGDKISCPQCGSTMLYVSSSSEDCKRISLIVLRKRKANKLSKDEIKMLKEAYEIASLVNSYGRFAVEALASRGVGLATARKVLQKLVFGQEAFYKALVEAETTYLKYIASRKRTSKRF
jgi:ATP-dependent Lhr-like helicase